MQGESTNVFDVLTLPLLQNKLLFFYDLLKKKKEIAIVVLCCEHYNKQFRNILMNTDSVYKWKSSRWIFLWLLFL